MKTNANWFISDLIDKKKLFFDNFNFQNIIKKKNIFLIIIISFLYFEGFSVYIYLHPNKTNLNRFSKIFYSLFWKNLILWCKTELIQFIQILRTFSEIILWEMNFLWELSEFKRVPKLRLLPALMQQQLVSCAFFYIRS